MQTESVAGQVTIPHFHTDYTFEELFVNSLCCTVTLPLILSRISEAKLEWSSINSYESILGADPFVVIFDSNLYKCS